jgi:DNA-binding response OmpR family regulator
MTQPLRVLVVEDHVPLREQVVALLTRAGHVVDEAADGRLGLLMALQNPPDVLLLDIGLPGLDGMRVCEALRAQSARYVPVLMLTARDALPDKLQGFNAGADDYLVKPFAGEELLARIQALSRRKGMGEDYLLSIGSLCIDRRARTASRCGQPLALPPIAFSILLMLAETFPRALSRSEIVEALWQGEAPDSDSLRTHIFQLRQQLDKPFEHAMLKTVHGVGFRLESDAVPSMSLDTNSPS